MRTLLAPFILRRLKTEVAGQLVHKTHVLREVRGWLGWLGLTEVWVVMSISSNQLGVVCVSVTPGLHLAPVRPGLPASQLLSSSAIV